MTLYELQAIESEHQALVLRLLVEPTRELLVAEEASAVRLMAARVTFTSAVIR